MGLRHFGLAIHLLWVPYMFVLPYIYCGSNPPGQAAHSLDVRTRTRYQRFASTRVKLEAHPSYVAQRLTGVPSGIALPIYDEEAKARATRHKKRTKTTPTSAVGLQFPTRPGAVEMIEPLDRRGGTVGPP